MATRTQHLRSAKPASPPAARRWLAAAAWAGAGLAVFAFFLRISFGGRINSDGANSVLQGWDLIHGHLLMHGWHLGDATFYAFELPLNGIVQLILGLGETATHVASALVYLIVAAIAVILAVIGSGGAARAARCAVVIAVLAAPLLYLPNVWTLLEEPDHPGTSLFILGSFLLIELSARPRARGGSGARGDGSRGAPHSEELSPPEQASPSLRFTAPLLAVILVAGQLSDLTVRYVAVPAIVLVCGYRVLAARKLRSADLAFAAAAVVSVPLESALRAVFTHFGGFVMVAPKAQLSSPRLWPAHASVTWLDVRILFGALTGPDIKLGLLGTAFGWACLVAALAGLARVAWTWRTATRAEQLLGVAIIVNVAVYAISIMPLPNVGSHEVVAALPCGAVLAARALVPARISGELRSFAAVAVTGLAALLPLTSAATRPPLPPATAPLSAWLAAHKLTYGVGGYWDASVVTLQSGGRVQIRAVDLHPHVNKPGWNINIPGWETNALWYNPKQYDATFAVADIGGRYPPSAFEQFFGKPAATYRVASWMVLVYKHNLLRQLLPMLP